MVVKRRCSDNWLALRILRVKAGISERVFRFGSFGKTTKLYKHGFPKKQGHFAKWQGNIFIPSQFGDYIDKKQQKPRVLELKNGASKLQIPTFLFFASCRF